MQLLLRGKKWTLRYVTRLRNNLAGDCDDPSTKDKTIRILKGLEPKELFRVYIHEIWHALHPDLSEEAVSEASESLRDSLWKLGYRKQ